MLTGLTDLQIETRKCRMTATRVAAVMGYSKFMSKGEAYEDLWGQRPSDPWPENPWERIKDRRFIGNVLEPAGVAILQELFPDAGFKHCELTLCRNQEPEGGFMLCLWTCFPIIRDWEAASPDALGDRVGGEIKVDAQGDDEWGDPMEGAAIETADEIPFGYLIQCQWNMHVLDLDRWFVLRWGPFYTPTIYVVNRDDVLIGKLRAWAERFFFHSFMAKKPPMDAGDPATMRALADAYSRPRKEWLIAESDRDVELLTKACELKARSKITKEQYDEVKSMIALRCTEYRGLKGEAGQASVYTVKGHSKPTVRITAKEK